MTINDSGYYESNTANTSDTQGDLTSNLETFNHINNDKFEQKLLSYRINPVFLPLTNQGIAEIKLTPQRLLTPAMKEIVMGVASGGAWTSRTTQQVIITGVDGSTPGRIDHSISIVEKFYPALIGTIVSNPTCGLNLSHDVGNIRQSTSPGLVRKSQKLDADFNIKFSDNGDLMSIFSKEIGENIQWLQLRYIHAL